MLSPSACFNASTNVSTHRKHTRRTVPLVCFEPIPTWALCYLINGDPTGLKDDEIAMIDKWYADNKVQTVTTASEAEGECNPYFSHFPAFGLPAEVTDCNVMTL